MEVNFIIPLIFVIVINLQICSTNLTTPALKNNIVNVTILPTRGNINKTFLPTSTTISPSSNEKSLRRGITPTDNQSQNQLESNEILQPDLMNRTDKKNLLNLTLNKHNVFHYKRSNYSTLLATSNVVLNSTKSNSNITTQNSEKGSNIIIVDKAKNDTQSVGAATLTSTSTILNTIMSTTATSATTTITSSTTSTTTPKPKKPKITYGVEDFPDLEKHIPILPDSSNGKTTVSTQAESNLPVEEAEVPNVQPSKEMYNEFLDGHQYRSHPDYILPIVAIMCAMPILMAMVIVAYRRVKEFWSTRHYRRMDFLVDGMYND